MKRRTLSVMRSQKGKPGLFASSSLQSKKRLPMTGYVIRESEGSLPRPDQQSTGLLVPRLRPGRPVRLLFPAIQKRIPMTGYVMGILFWSG